MIDQLLTEIYKSLYEEDFDSKNEQNRKKMQAGVYLLGELGVPTGYSFSWYRQGPKSLELIDDMNGVRKIIPKRNDITVYHTFAFMDLRNAFKMGEMHDVSIERWIDRIASIYYIKSEMRPQGATQKEILDKLITDRPNLNDDAEVNNLAYEEVLRLLAPRAH